MAPQLIGPSFFLHLFGRLIIWLIKGLSFVFIKFGIRTSSWIKRPTISLYSSVFPLFLLAPVKNYLAKLNRENNQTSTLADEKKRLAVLIPAYNEELVIKKTIDSAVAAGIELEDIYVVDNCSTDKTSQIAKNLEVNVLSIQEKGKAKAIRAGLKYFQITERYRWLQIVDADSFFEREYFKEISQYFNQPGVAAICGQVKSNQKNLVSKFRSFEYTITHDVYRSTQGYYNIVNVIPGPASCFNTKVFRKINFETDTLTEDMDFTIAIHRYQLGQIVYCPKARVITQDPLTIRDYYRQIRRWYSGLFQVIKKRRLGIKFQKIDFEVALLTLEGLWFSAFFIFLTLSLLFNLLPLGNFPIIFLFLDALVFLVLLSYTVGRTKNIKVLLLSPCFYLFRYLNALTFIQSFILVFIFNRYGNWGKIRRQAN